MFDWPLNGRRSVRLSRPLRRLLTAAVFGAAAGVTLAQTLEDEGRYCLADCTARGYDGEYCGTVCDYSDVVRQPPEGLIDGRCVTACFQAGGRVRDCRAYCRKE